MSELGRRDGGRLDSLPNLLPPGLSGVRGSEPETLHDPLPPHQWRCFCCCGGQDAGQAAAQPASARRPNPPPLVSAFGPSHRGCPDAGDDMANRASRALVVGVSEKRQKANPPFAL